MNGLPAIVSYATQTFAMGSSVSSDELTILMGGVLLVSTFIGAFIVDHIGRRPLLIMSAAGSFIFNLGIGKMQNLYIWLTNYSGSN